MTVAFSNDAWGDYARHWPRLKREILNVVDLRMRHIAEGVDHEPTGANYFPIPFRNESGETVPAYGVMRVTGVEFVASVPLIIVAKPSTAFQRMYLVNGPMQVSGDSNQDRRGFGTWLSDAGFVLYDDSNTPAYGEGWGPSASSWKIKKWRYGFTILGGATGGDTDIVAARQDIVNEFYGQTDGAHNKGSTGTISIFDGNNADTTDNQTSVTNRYGNVATTKKVTVRWHGGTWGIVSAECP